MSFQKLSLILSIITASLAQVMAAEKQWHDPQYCRVLKANSSFPDQAIWRMRDRSTSGTEEAIGACRCWLVFRAIFMLCLCECKTVGVMLSCLARVSLYSILE